MLIHGFSRASTRFLGFLPLVLTLWIVGATFVVRGAAAEPVRSEAPQEKSTVLITGANRGLGLEFAKQYHEAGWNVVGTAREPAAAKELLALGVRVEELDVADAKSVAALAEKLKGQPIDLLVNNAGISSVEGPLADLDLAAYERVLQVNTLGPVRVTQALLPNLRAGKRKEIVSLSSQLGSLEDNTRGGFYAYRESKAALCMFTRTLAAELKGEGFICIALSPGWVKTDMGGPDARLTPEESIGGMREVIEALEPDDSGKSLLYDGSVVAW